MHDSTLWCNQSTFLKEITVNFKKTILVSLLAGLVGMQWAHADTDPGLTDKTIKLGVFGPLSGNAMAYGYDVINAAKMYYDQVNKEGGVHGRKIELVIEDDRCNANDLLAAIKKLTEQDKVFALNGGSCSGPVVGAREYVERAQIPFVMLNASGDGALYPPSKYIYGAFSISQRAVGGSMVQFAFEHLKAKKIGYINHDDAYGGWNLEAAEFQSKQIGAELQLQSINPNITDVTAPMLKIKAANPDALIITTYARPVSLLVKKAHELGWNKPIVIAVNGTADLKQLVENVGNREAFKNVYLQEVMLDVPGGAKLKWVYDMYKQYYPELAAKPGYPQTYMPYGIPSAMTVVNALKAAGPQLTREKFLTALSQTKFDSKVMAGPIELTAIDHAGQKSAIYLKFDGENKTAVPGSYRSAWSYQPK
jgi:branched-chain amino acid transport system substrate-binding protein